MLYDDKTCLTVKIDCFGESWKSCLSIMMGIRPVIAGIYSIFWHGRDCSALISEAELYRFGNFERNCVVTVLMTELIQCVAVFSNSAKDKHIQVSTIWLDYYINVPIEVWNMFTHDLDLLEWWFSYKIIMSWVAYIDAIFKVLKWYPNTSWL